MKRFSLRIIILGAFLIPSLMTFGALYFLIGSHKDELIDANIQEKIRLAEVIKEITASPTWVYRIAPLPEIEETFLEEMARFEDIIFIRIVSRDGIIYKSSIRSEWGESIKEQKILKALNEGKILIEDQLFNKKRMKTIIYPGRENKTILVGFSLMGVEEQVKWTWIRDITVTGGGLLLLFLILFLIVERSIISPFKKIVLVSEKARKGNLDVKIDLKSKTEVGELSDILNEMFRDLKNSYLAIEESKNILEIRVRAATRDLRELTENLDKQVKEKTKEFREKAEEAEKFNKLAVGRELKMIELKKEIERLKKELEELKGKSPTLQD